MELSEEYKLRQSYPLYNAFCREEEDGDFLGEDPKYTVEVERANYE